MTAPIPKLFADITAKLEDLHAVAVEGQCHDHSADMQIVFAAHLCMGVAALETALQQVRRQLGDEQERRA
jgi:hypothetical protein